MVTIRTLKMRNSSNYNNSSNTFGIGTYSEELVNTGAMMV